MSSEKALVPLEQKQVVFYDDTITAVVAQADSRRIVYVPLRPLCSFLGVAWAAQRQRILRDPVLAEQMRPVIVTITGTGQEVESLCLPLDYLNGWLFGINATRVKPQIRDRLIRYQRECYAVLAEAFQEGRLTSDPILDELLQSNTDAVQAYKMLQALVKLARNQILIEAQLDAHATQLASHEQRLEEITTILSDAGRSVTPEQASQISQAVKAVALVLSKQSGSNQYGSVYGELYRRFGITSYKLLPASRFAEAMDFLTNWHQDLVSDAPF